MLKSEIYSLIISICNPSLSKLKIMSTYDMKYPQKQSTWNSPIQQIGEFQIDHVAISYPTRDP